LPKLNRKQIQEQTLALLESAPGGIRWSELLKAIAAANPDTPLNSIRGATHALFSADGRIENLRGAPTVWLR
jgi:hypothetical protein